MRRHLLASTPVRLAAVAFTGAFVMLAMVVAGAARTEPVRRLPTVSAAGTITLVRPDTTTDALVSAAVDANIFAPSRARPAARVASEPIVLNRQSGPSAALQLIGTVVDPTGGDFALCQLGTDAPKIVRIGQSVGSYVLRRISQGSASFESSNGDRLELRVSKTGS